MTVEDGKSACSYPDVCLSPTGEKTAYRPDKETEYAEVIGRKFRPTFESNIDHFEIRGYDAERDMVLTTVYPKDGSPFDDEIEEQYLMGGFNNGDYEPVDQRWSIGEQTMRLFANPYYMPPPPKPMKRKFFGPCCDRCQHRFGTTSNREWCSSHYQNDRCYRFKMKKK